MRRTILAAIVIAFLGVIGPAMGAAPDGLGPWADYVVDFHQGTAFNLAGNPGGSVLLERSDPTQALGPAESPPGNDDPIPTGTFFSLGFGGSITLGFENPICNVAGVDLAIDVREITLETFPPERAQIYVSEDGINFLLAGTVTKDGTVGMPAGITVANFVRVVDVSNPADFLGVPFADGFDLDGVAALNSSCAPGMIEICKASANGMSNRPFQFSLNGGPPITVRGGRCSGPIRTMPGLNTVRELETNPATDVSAVTVRPSARLISQDLASRLAVIKVVSGSTAASESRVTFTNVPGGGLMGDLKICKLTETPAYFGRLFTFHVNAGPAFSTEANPAFDPPANWSCRPAGTFRQGTIVTVQEDIPVGTEVAFIDTDPADRLVDFDTNTGTSRVTIGSGTTVVLYDDEPIPPTGAGFIEICKDPALVDVHTLDPDVTGPFDFRIDEPDGSSQEVTVVAGQCSASIPVASGVVRVTELGRAGFTLVDAFTIPNERVLDSNLINRTADVEVPASDDVNDETQVHFVNLRERGQLKICKTLGPGSADLIGRTFSFTLADVTDPNDPHSIPLRDPITVTASEATQCVIVGNFPIGSVIEVHESDSFAYVTTTSANNPATIAAGINTVTFTNTAVGKLEICKFVTDPLVSPETEHQFVFRIDGGSPIKVRPGRCSTPQLVSVGSHTVTEASDPNYELDPTAPGNGITVTPSQAETGRNLLARSVTVTVPWAGDPSFTIGREVRVDYYNRIRRAQIKICKHIEPGSVDALGSKEFDFTVVTTNNTTRQYRVTGLSAEECGLVRDGQGNVVSFPIILPTGAPVIAIASEDVDQQQPQWEVSNITVQGGRGIYALACSGNPQVCLPFVYWYLGPNTNTVHFTNRTGGETLR
jgi:hypothetical protein